MFAVQMPNPDVIAVAVLALHTPFTSFVKAQTKKVVVINPKTRKTSDVTRNHLKKTESD